MFTKLIAQLRAVVSRRRIAGEIDDERRDHVEREAAANEEWLKGFSWEPGRAFLRDFLLGFS